MRGRPTITRTAWRMVAIYRCCVHFNMSREWALSKVREVCPRGRKDHMVDLWFTDMQNVRDLQHRKMNPQAPSSDDQDMLQLAA